MVLEILVNPKKVTGKPWEMFFIGAVYSLVGVLLGYWVFRSYVSIIMVTFTTIAAIPFVLSAINSEGQKGRTLSRGSLLREHGKIISMFTFLFLGFVTVFFSLFVFLPSTAVTEIFSSQISSINEVRTAVTGNFIAEVPTMLKILLNNFKVLFFCIIFSLFYGSGALFILAWNASVMGAAIGVGIRSGLSSSLYGNVQAFATSLLGYFAHGIPEIIAYFVAGLAGGIISFAIMKEKFGSKAFRKISLDAANLVIFAIIILILAALIEVFVSPTVL